MRRYAPLTAKPGHRDPVSPELRIAVLWRDRGCLGVRLLWPGECFGRLELDHVRASAMGKRSPSTADNLVSLCSTHHRYKTENGRAARPQLLAYLAQFKEVA